MITVEKSIMIDKPPAEVFAYAADFDKVTKWQEDVEAIELEGPANAVGGKYTEVRKFLGREMRTTLEITAYEPGAKWAAKVLEGPVPYEVTIKLEAADGGTKMAIRTEGEPSGFFKLAQGVVQGQLEKSLEQDLQRLKELLEAN
jgi:uncharacterized membrane protein